MMDDNNSDISVRTRSVASNSSSTSRLSIAKQKAKAEAAKVRLHYAKKQAQLLKEETEAKIKRDLLQTECEVEEAEAELRVLETVGDDFNEEYQDGPGDALLLGADALSQTYYMASETPLRQSNRDPDNKLDSNANDISFIPNRSRSEPRLEINVQEFTPRVHKPTPMYMYKPLENGRFAENTPGDPLRLTPEPQGPRPDKPDNVLSELSKYMMRKDLLKQRLAKFSDSPATYLIWKTTFLSVMAELDVTSAEELDLLLQYLGPNSSKYATTIRAANVRDPQKGLRRIWERLEEEYGRPEVIQTSLNTRLANFPKLTNKENKKLFDLWDLLSEIEAIKEDPSYSSLLSYFDTTAGIGPILNKLPYSIQERWAAEAVKFRKTHDMIFPPFSHFVQFIHQTAQVKNDPCLSMYQQPNDTQTKPPAPAKFSKMTSPPIRCNKTDVATVKLPPEGTPRTRICPIHNTNHSLNDCKGFRAKSLDERKQFLKQHGLCFKCCGTVKHLAKDCKLQTIRCGLCSSDRHPTGLHVDLSADSQSFAPKKQGGEPYQREPQSDSENTVLSRCTKLCGPQFTGRSCAKIVLVKVYPEGRPDLSRNMYAMIDDQSNRSLAKSDFFDIFGEKGSEMEYTLQSCSGRTTVSGRRATNYVIKSMDDQTSLKLPTLIECDQIPDCRREIPTPEVAVEFPHLKDIAQQLPPIDETADILLLLGRDLTQVHQVLDQRVGPGNSPYAQRLSLGWVIIGEVCLGKVHMPQVVNVRKTLILHDGRPTLFPPCDNSFTITECNLEEVFSIPDSHIFIRTSNDSKVGESVEDREFNEIMEEEMRKDHSGHWEAPLPFRKERPQLPNNRTQALDRARLLERGLTKDSQKREHFFTFMQKLLDEGFAEEAPPVSESTECWYLPIFGVYHPKKKSQIRVVFDSSAKYQGVSLNQVLLSGPNLTNDLIGVLLRFRLGRVAATADIQQMFYAFKVQETHRDYLRFFWYKNNDIEQPLTEFRMTVHVFGNTTSPAVAAYALRKTVQDSDADVKQFVTKQFYVDDGLLATDSVDQAGDILRRTQRDLQQKGKLRLHKVASNSVELMKQFPCKDLAKELQSLDFSAEYLPFHSSLGLSWALHSDCFTFQVQQENKPFTKRGVLATINSVYDPIGFLAPVLLDGRIMLRDFTNDSKDADGWDEPLPDKFCETWKNWVQSLDTLRQLNIPRPYAPVPLSTVDRKQLHVFCDASEKAIAAVAYLRFIEQNEEVHVGFAFGKAKLAPSQGHTLPRLELCAAVLAVEVAEIVQEALGIQTKETSYYTDSQVVLGYINNRSRRFYTYVSNRVERIRHSSEPSQWHHIRTELNPADVGTRAISAVDLADSPWLSGPACLTDLNSMNIHRQTYFPLVEPECDKEVRSCRTEVQREENLGSRFHKFSRWQSLVNAIRLLQSFIRRFKARKDNQQPAQSDSIQESDLAERLILKVTQSDYYYQEIENIKSGKSVPKTSPIISLSPFLDTNGLLRVGGRIENANLNYDETHPIILPGKSHVALLVVRMCHEKTFHQGRLITEGAVRSTGFWVTGGKRLIVSLLRHCVRCKKLRGGEQLQVMAALPKDRLVVTAPFSNVGVDVFGPWEVLTRKTRGGQANNKRWAALFTCLTTRAIHIEVLEEMSASSFINALRRLIALRGPVMTIRSDRGTNFVGAEKQLKDVKWVFNPPHSSHMGGVWERMIGIARRILDSMFTDISTRANVTHEVLVTLMAEVSAIMNSRPITTVSTDPDNPLVLSPALLLTHKSSGETSQQDSDVDMRDIYRSQWKRVQYLSELFWQRWRKEYLATLQVRQKWTETLPNITEDSVVLLKDKETVRGQWPLGRISQVLPSADGKVRKVMVTVHKDGKKVTYERPIAMVIPLDG